MLVTQLSTEAEYIATAHAACEICWLRSFLKELGAEEPGPTTLLLDNQSTITIVNNNKFHTCTKHIDIRYHFIHKAVEEELIVVKYVPTSENIADRFTKPLARPAFEIFIRELVLLSI